MKYTPADAWKIFTELFSFKWAKYSIGAGLAAIMNWVAAAPPVVQKLLWAAMLLILLDIVSGIVASVVVKKRRISSAVFGRSLVKVFVYGGVMLLGFIVDVFIGQAYTVTMLIISIVVATEGISCLENLRAVWEKLGYRWRFDFLADSFRKVSPEPKEPKEFRNGAEED